MPVTRCPRCLLPSNFPGIRSEGNECSYCKKYASASQKYRGEARLKADIAAILSQYPDRSAAYDAVVGYSGGMDSTYLLRYATRALGLKVLAVTMRHRYIPEDTIRNIERVAALLRVEVAFIDNPYLDEYADFFIRQWARRPTAAGLIGFCTGCRYGLTRLLPEVAAERGVHILLTGENQFERSNFKLHTVMLNPDKPSAAGLALGYGRELLMNPGYLTAPGKLAFQLREFTGKKKRGDLLKARGITRIRPFYDYVEWDPDAVRAALDEMGWRKGGDAAQAWRSDCEIGLIRQHYYRRLLGFNDREVKRAHLLRAGKAPGTIEDTDEAVIRRIMGETFGLDYDEIERRIEERQQATGNRQQ